jgi:hypothetical protein
MLLPRQWPRQPGKEHPRIARRVRAGMAEEAQVSQASSATRFPHLIRPPERPPAARLTIGDVSGAATDEEAQR